MSRPTHVVVSSYLAADQTGRYYLAPLKPDGRAGETIKTQAFLSDEPLNDRDLVVLRDGKAERARR